MAGLPPAPGGGRTPSDVRRRDQRGAVLPSPVVMLSIVAIALAAVAFFVTRGDDSGEREVAQASSSSETPSPEENGEESESPSADESESEKPKPPPVVRSEVGVVVFNNTNISGLAGTVLDQVAGAGWQAIAADDWSGTVPATTVYFPPGKQPAAKQLALDLGIARVLPADESSNMSTTNLTVILTGALS